MSINQVQIENEKISILSNVVIAFSTFIGVGAAIAYYLKDIKNSAGLFILLSEIIYILAVIFTIRLIKKRMQ